MGYPKDFLESRAVIRHGRFAIVPPEGRVINVIPGFEGFEATILTSPKMGAQSCFYISKVLTNAKTTIPWGDDGVETFVYFMDGDGELEVNDKYTLTQGGYVYLPEGVRMSLRNDSGKEYRILLYKQKYIKLDGYRSEEICGNVNDITETYYAEMENVFIKDLLPTHLGFDMNMHILAFEPGGCHPFIETHVQEHGAYILQGQGYYQLGDNWYQVKKEDFLWMGPFTQQGCYGTGRERITYIYSKDCNRDEEL